MRKIFCFLVVVCFCITFAFFVTVVKGRETEKEFLFGEVVYVDAGHGGKDNGASFSGVLEDEINLKISGYVIGLLIDLGAYVLTSRTGDYDLSNIYDKNKKRQDLINRVSQINEGKVDLFVSIHLNSFSSSSVSGAQVFSQTNDQSKSLACLMQERLNILMNRDKKVKTGDYYILNKTNRTGVLVECGFLSNEIERNLLLKSEYQQKIAKSVVLGIVDYFKN